MNWLTSRCAPLLALSALALAGCDKGTDLNVDLPDTAATSTEYKDLPVEAATVRLAPVQTLKADHFLVGRLADNVAGTTEARAYFNVVSGPVVADSLPGKLTAPVLDSVVLVMGFDKVYGSGTTPVKFDAFKLQTPLDEREVYDANSARPLGDALGLNLTSRLNRTQQATTGTVPDQTIRLLVQRRAVPAVPPVGTTPGQPALPAVASQFATDLYNKLSLPAFGQAQLDAVLKGLAVVPSAGYTGSILSFGRSFDSRIVVYFHGDNAPRRTYSAFVGPVYSAHGSAPTRDPRYFTQILNTLPTALAALNSSAGAVDKALLNNTSYVQEGIGFGTRITFTGLTALMNTPGLTVNRAELRVPVKPFTNALLPNSAQLYAVEVDGSNNVLQRVINFVPSDRVVQADGFDQLGNAAPAISSLIEATTNQPYYSLPITNYLDAYLKSKLGDNPAALVLVPNIRMSNSLSLDRAALDAANITLRVYYSKR